MSGGHNFLRTVALAVLFLSVPASNAAELPIPPLAEVVHRDAEAIRGIYPGMLDAAQRRFTQRFHRAGFRGETLVGHDKTRLFLWTRQERNEEVERVFLHLSQRDIGRTSFLLGHDPGEAESPAEHPTEHHSDPVLKTPPLKADTP